jgi:hypothetical protein
MSTLDKVADAAYWPTYVASKMDPVSAILSAASPNNPDLIHAPTIPAELVKEALKYSMIAPNRPDSTMAGVQNFTAGMVSGMSSPHGLAGLMSGGINRALPAATFIPPMVSSIPQTTEQLLQAQNPAQATEGGLNLLSSLVFPLLMAKHAEQPRTGQGARPSDFGPYIIEPDVLPPAPPRQVAPGRRLGQGEPLTIDVEGPTQIPLTSASTLAERNNPQPFGQVIRSQEPVDPATYRLGREREPMQVPQPEDLRTVVRQSVEEAMGRLISNEKRPSQEAPVLLGGQQTQAPMVYGPRPVPLDVKVEPGQAFVPRERESQFPPAGPMPYKPGEVLSQSELATKDSGVPSRRLAAELQDQESRLATKQDQPAALPVEPVAEQKPVPFVYKGIQPGVPEAGIPDFHLYNMTETVGKLAKGSTVSEMSLKAAGFEIPEGMPKSGGMKVKEAQEKAAKQRGETGAVFPEGNEKRFSKKLEDEINYMRQTFDEDADPGETLSRNDAIRRLLEDYTDKSHWSSEFKKELEDYQISTGIVKPYTAKQLESITVTKGKKYDFRRGDIFYRFEGWGHLKEPFDGGPVQGMKLKEAVEKNKEAGSILNPFEGLRERFKKKEEEQRGDFALDGPRLVLDPKAGGFTNPTKEVDSAQLWNRVRNRISKTEVEGYEKSGVAEKIRNSGKISPEKAAELMQEGGERVETAVYGMEGKVSEFKKEFDDLTHSWYDTLDNRRKNAINFIKGRAELGSIDPFDGLPLSVKSEITGIDQTKLKRYVELASITSKERVTGPRATSAYDTVSAFSTKEPMPEWTKTKSGKNVQRVDVVIPQEYKEGYKVIDKDGKQYGQYPDHEIAVENKERLEQEYPELKPWRTAYGGTETFPIAKWKQDNLHENLPNTLGWAMIQYKDGPKGEKIAVIAEAQSRWGQSNRERIKQSSELLKRLDSGEADASGYKRDMVEKQAKDDHPLLRDYNRLILKAAIDQARKEGATHIVVSDAESAMMTEGHDINVSGYSVLEHGSDVIPFKDLATMNEYINTHGYKRYGVEINEGRHSGPIYQREDGKLYQMRVSPNNEKGVGLQEITKLQENRPAQESGMRLNYDTILPKIAEELTGVKGERVSLGEHKNAFDAPHGRDRRNEIEQMVERGDISRQTGDRLIKEETAQKLRSNLIFRNSDGTPKTDVSGLMYPLDKVPAQKASLYEKDRPETRGTKLYGGAFFFDPDFWRDTFSKGKGGKPERVVGGLQKLDTYEKEFARANKVQGAGKLGKTIGGLLDPRRKAVGNEVAQALVAWHSQVDTGRKMATLWAESRKRLGDIVADEKDGKIALADGSRGFMGDVFEREIAKPGSQPLTPQQKQAVEFAKRALRDTGVELTKENVKGFLESDKDSIDLSEPYFPRPAIGKVDKKMEAMPGKRAIGSERFFQKGRKFPTEQMGYESGIRYEPSFYGRVSDYLQNYYRAIADERLATHLEKLSESEHKFMENALTYHPAFRGRYFSDAGYQAINKSLDRPSHQFEKIARGVQNYKKVKFTADVSYLFNQLLPTLVMNPVGWGTAAKQGFKALVNENALSEYLAKPVNLKAAQRIVQNGGGIGNLWEFIGGAEREGIVDKIRPIKASGRAMQVALDTAKIELYKSLEPVMKKQGWSEAELVEAIGNAVYSAPAKGIGVSDTRAIIEKLAFNAPNYLRATANILANLGTEGLKNNPAGYVARRAVVGLGAAIMIQFGVLYMSMVKLGLMDEDEMKDRLNPTKPQFLKLPVKVPMGKEGGLEGSADDKVVEMSYGNIFLSLARAAGAMGAIATGEKEGALLGGDNPGIRFVSARLSPWWNVVQKIITGENYKGQKKPALELISEELLPIVLNPVLEEGVTSKAGAVAAVGSGIGFSTSIESRGARQKRLEKEYAQQVYKAPIDKLNVTQRRKAGAMAELALAGEEKEGPSLYSLEAPKKRAEKVMGLLSPESRAMLENAKLGVPNIIASQTKNAKPLKLNKEEQVFFLEAYAKELDKRLQNVKRSGLSLNEKSFENITQSVGQATWTKTKAMINTRAKGEVSSQR